jgi:hypothetical protein
MNRALLTHELRGIEARAAKTARLIQRQRTVVARLEKAGALLSQWLTACFGRWRTSTRCNPIGSRG